jgi:hypothetical protein
MSRGLEPAPPPDKPFVRDYSHCWTLPPPLPTRLPLARLVAVAAVLILALCVAVLASDALP